METYVSTTVTYPDGNEIFFVKTLLPTVSKKNALDMLKIEKKKDFSVDEISIDNDTIIEAGYHFGQKPKYSIDETGKVSKE